MRERHSRVGASDDSDQSGRFVSVVLRVKLQVANRFELTMRQASCTACGERTASVRAKPCVLSITS